MFELQNTPLDALISRSKQDLGIGGTTQDALSELIRRAVQDKNDAAWDALVALLRPRILDRLYNSAFDVAPSNAESLVYRSLNRFRRVLGSMRAVERFPHTQAALGLLNKCVDGVLDEG